MRKRWMMVLVPGVFVIVLVVFVVALLLVKLLWGWTVPDLFPGGVRQGLVAESISWFTALKLALFLAVLFGVARMAITGIRGRDRR